MPVAVVNYIYKQNKMKTHKVIIFFAILPMILLQSCKEDEGEIGAPFSKVEGLTATEWVFEQAFVIDESNPSGPQKDISTFYQQGEPLRISFGEDGSFSVIPGSGKNVFPDNGTWSFFPSDEAPTEIRVDDGTGVTRMLLAGPTRIVEQQLRIRFVTKTCEIDGETKPAVGYRFVFNRAN